VTSRKVNADPACLSSTLHQKDTTRPACHEIRYATPSELEADHGWPQLPLFGAALSLHRVGLDVNVFEQARDLREVGAGIQISPNASPSPPKVGAVPISFCWREGNSGPIDSQGNLLSRAEYETQRRYGWRDI